MRPLSKLLPFTILAFFLSLIPFSAAFSQNSKDEQKAKQLVKTYFKALNKP